jgi:hypothetical protein
VRSRLKDESATQIRFMEQGDLQVGHCGSHHTAVVSHVSTLNRHVAQARRVMRLHRVLT